MWEKILDLFVRFIPPTRVQKQILFSEISLLLAEGITIVTALTTVLNEKKDMRIKRSLKMIRQFIVQGYTVQQAFLMEGRLLNKFQCETIGIAEKFGTLSQTFEHIAVVVVSKKKLLMHIVVATVSFFFTLLFITATSAVAAKHIVHKRLVALWANHLPLPKVSDAFFLFYRGATPYYVILCTGGVLLLSFLLVYMAQKTNAGRRLRDKMYLLLPIVRRYHLAQQSVIFLTYFRSLTHTGCSRVKCLEQTIPVVSNLYLQRELIVALHEIHAGREFGRALWACRLFTGEESLLQKNTSSDKWVKIFDTHLALKQHSYSVIGRSVVSVYWLLLGIICAVDFAWIIIAISWTSKIRPP